MPIAKEKSRGYYKIKGASDAFNFDFRNKIVLDIGSSTGGFTEYALNHGAKKVIAIEKGTNQMAKHLRFNDKIELHEKTSIFDTRISKTSFEGHPQLLRGRSDEPCEDRREERPEKEALLILTPDVILADVSFISLKDVLLHAKKYLAGNHTEFLVMLKPQFEAKPNELTNGVVKNETIRRQIIKQFEQWLKTHNFLIVKKRDNDLRGKTGNIERFYYLKLAK